MKECILQEFDNQFDFCQSCVIVEEKNHKDVNNCYCVQCVMSALNAHCLKNACTNPKQLNNLQVVMSGFISNNLTKPQFVKQEKLSSKTSFKRRMKGDLNYYKDQNQNLYRNLFQNEKSNLVDSLLSIFQANYSSFNSVKRVGPRLSPLWGRRKRRERKESYTYETKSRPLYYTTTDIFTTYWPDESTSTEWKPIVTETTRVVDKCSDRMKTIIMITTQTGVETKTMFKKNTLTDTKTMTKTHLSTTTCTDTVTRTHTVKQPKISFVTTTTTDYDTETIRKIRTKVKNRYATTTDTEYKVKTKVKYKHDFVTTTETEIEESTRLIKIAKKTITDYEVYTKFKTKRGTDTITTTETKTKLKLKFKKKWKTVTSTTYQTATKTEHTTSTKTKRRWFPRTTTVTATATITTTTTTSLFVPGLAAAPAMSGIRFRIFNATDDNDVKKIIVTRTRSIKTTKDIPLIPTVSSHIKLGTLDRRGLDATGDGKNTSSHLNNSTDGISLQSPFESLASTIDTKNILFTTLAASICTLSFIIMSMSFPLSTFRARPVTKPQENITHDILTSEKNSSYTKDTIDSISSELINNEVSRSSIHLCKTEVTLQNLVKQLSVD